MPTFGGGVCIRLNDHIGRPVTTNPRVDGELVTQLASQQRVNWNSEFASYSFFFQSQSAERVLFPDTGIRLKGRAIASGGGR